MYKLLIAEDEIWISALIKSIVSEIEDVTVVGEAENGRIALEMIEHLAPDIVLVDINMPIKTGLEVIEATKSFGYPCKFIIISGYKDFSYVQQAIRIGVEDYLLKPIDDEKLCATIRTVIDKIKSENSASMQNQRKDMMLKLHFFKKVIMGNTITLGEVNNAYCLNFAPGLFKCCTFKFVHRSLEHSYLILSFLGEIIQKFSASFDSKLKPICIEAFYISQGSHIITFFNFTKENEYKVDEALSLLFSELLNDCANQSIQVTMGISETTDSLIQLSIAYRQAQHAVSSRLVRGSGKMLPYVPDERSNSIPPDPVTLTQGDISALHKALHSVNADDLISWFNHILDGYIAKYNIIETETFLVLNLFFSLLPYLSNALKELPMESSFKESDFSDTLENCSTVQEFRSTLNDLLTKFKASVDNNKNASDMTIKRVLSYIDEHLTDTVSLEDAANVAYLSPSYLSEYFKAKMGMNFKDYIQKRRMDRATELLKNKKNKIRDVASLCGYSDVKYFCKLFKSVIGVTPTEFRRIYC